MNKNQVKKGEHIADLRDVFTAFQNLLNDIVSAD